VTKVLLEDINGNELAKKLYPDQELRAGWYVVRGASNNNTCYVYHNDPFMPWPDLKYEPMKEGP